MGEWKLVPVDPTAEMNAAAYEYANQCAIHNYGACADHEGLWYAMLEATPPPPAVDWERRVALDAAQIATLSARLTAALARAEKAEAEVARLKAAMKLADLQYMGAGGNLRPEEVVEAMRSIIATTLSTEGGDRG